MTHAPRAIPASSVFRVRDRFGEWRHLEASVTDLRADRWVRSVVLNARDVTERIALEEELTRQAFHDGLTACRTALFSGTGWTRRWHDPYGRTTSSRSCCSTSMASSR